MKKFKKVMVIILSIGIIMSLSAIVFAEMDNSEMQMNKEAVSPCGLKTITGTNDQYGDSHGVTFKFTASANVVYDKGLERFTMSSVTTARPENIFKVFSGVSTTTTMPTVSYVDGKRTAVIQTTASIQNKTGYLDTKEVTIYVYCEGRDGSLAMGLL